MNAGEVRLREETDNEGVDVLPTKKSKETADETLSSNNYISDKVEYPKETKVVTEEVSETSNETEVEEVRVIDKKSKNGHKKPYIDRRIINLVPATGKYSNKWDGFMTYEPRYHYSDPDDRNRNLRFYAVCSKCYILLRKIDVMVKGCVRGMCG